MLMMEVVISLQSLLSHRATLPVAGGAFAGLAFAVLRLPLRPFGIREAESLMNFSSLGSLRCICGTNHPKHLGSDRREFCRSCGCEIVAVDSAQLERAVSKDEARKVTRGLRDAAIQASRLELPDTIRSVAELQAYLASDGTKLTQREKRALNGPVEQPQVR